jgi:hypothetical protein
MSRATTAPLVEGVDYYMEAGKLVFTSAYHQKRGYCCNSRCRHCPYGADHAGPRIDFAGMPGPRLVGPGLRGR